MIVLDASVVLKWIFDDEDGEGRATSLKDAHVAGHEIVAAPDLLFYEIGNVLTTKTRLSEAAIAEAFSLLWNFSLERFDLGLDEFQGGLALSRKYKITLYRVSSRAAISSLSRPLAAIKIILARTTSKYGNVYLAARRFNSTHSSGVNSIWNGLFLGMGEPSTKVRVTMPYVPALIKTIRDPIYETAH